MHEMSFVIHCQRKTFNKSNEDTLLGEKSNTRGWVALENGEDHSKRHIVFGVHVGVYDRFLILVEFFPEL